MITTETFKDQILQGIPKELPMASEFDYGVSHAPRRKDILSQEEKKLAISNALRYFHPRHHAVLAPEFYDELQNFGRIYMYRFRPKYEMKARAIDDYPYQCIQGAAIQLMIQNNLDPKVAQHPHELITYGGNGAVFQNWAQYLLTMKYLATMNDEQTLHIYSGHPMGLFPSSKEAPRVVVTNGMMIPNYSKPDDWERFNALGVTQYGQMTAGSYMYIGPQGIVHGTNITILNAGRKISKKGEGLAGKLFLTSGLGGMSGAQPKAGNIAGCITVVAEINEAATQKRFQQGWVDEVVRDLTILCQRVRTAKSKKEIVSIAYQGNIVDVWQKFADENIVVDLGSDQTSLHNPWAGGYYPAGMSFEDSNKLMVENPEQFNLRVQDSLRKQAQAINTHVSRGTYFFDYGNAFLLEASRAGADVIASNEIDFKYPSYVQDIMGPMCFDYGFGPFRWVCASGKQEDLDYTDALATEILSKIVLSAPDEIQSQLKDNIDWIRSAKANNLVVGSKARILYADAEGRIKIATAFNEAVAQGKIGPVILGRDHHDVSGTDSPYRETSNIYDGSRFTADMAIHNVIGDSFRGATWVSIHNGGGVGWGEVINGGFGMLLDGSTLADRKLRSMLHFDVNNGIARRAWARNAGALTSIERAQLQNSGLQVTTTFLTDQTILDKLF
ncbi:MAG: urocanate hydratase [Cyclobacteriaceae bacterium]|nr:urocanate hydratase [Cyclobacteriaceae bacterium]